ncbi:MAG TPA: HAMP domain-containing sensor histidine kinase [Polyangiaceae bacterium]|nr:HAMP domain-containing sensor histidine kinase [Polyangiaceae bacterium]
MPGGSRLGRSALYFFLPTVVAAVLVIGAYTYRASFQLEQVRQQSVVEATLSLTNEKVDRLDRLVIEQDNVVAAEVDAGGLDEVGANWLPTAARETPTVRAVLLLDLASEGREVVAFASRAPGPEDEAFRRLLVRRVLADFELWHAPEGELRHLHKTYNGQSYLLSYWQRPVEGRRHLVVAWHDVPRLVHEVFPRLYADATGRARVSVVDEEGRLVYGAALPSGEFTVGRPFPTTLYGWRLQVALTAADEIAAKAERRRQLEFGLVASACVVIVAGVAFALYAVAKEQRLNRQKIELVANVSHELKTPLALVRMFAEMLHSGRAASEEKRRQYLQIILLESERLGALIENVLDFARLERGGAAFDFAPADLGEVVQRAVEVVRYRAESEGMDLTTRLPPELPEARVDARAIELALINLLDNAIKYAKDGKTLEVGAVCHRYAAELYVRDAGPGLPPDEQRKVFERFERGRAAREGRVRGSGIGLALVKHIAEAHGGYAQVRSGPGGGATFVITLPLADAAPASTGRPLSPEP